jgi:hypothetical protein
LSSLTRRFAAEGFPQLPLGLQGITRASACSCVTSRSCQTTYVGDTAHNASVSIMLITLSATRLCRAPHGVYVCRDSIVAMERIHILQLWAGRLVLVDQAVHQLKGGVPQLSLGLESLASACSCVTRANSRPDSAPVDTGRHQRRTVLESPQPAVHGPRPAQEGAPCRVVRQLAVLWYCTTSTILSYCGTVQLIAEARTVLESLGGVYGPRPAQTPCRVSCSL